MLLRENHRREFKLLPTGFEREMSRFFYSHRQIWQPELDSLLLAIKSDRDEHNSVTLDPKIIPVVISLRLHGITTSMSCEGHRGRCYTNPGERESPYVQFGHVPLPPDMSGEKLAYASRVIPEIRTRLRLKGMLLNESDLKEPDPITDMSQLTIDFLGPETYFAINEIFHVREELCRIKSQSALFYIDLVKLFTEMLLLQNLLDDFYTEVPFHTSRIEVGELKNYAAFLKIAKQHKHDTLLSQQAEFSKFADYLLGRYLVAKHSTH